MVSARLRLDPFDLVADHALGDLESHVARDLVGHPFDNPPGHFLDDVVPQSGLVYRGRRRQLPLLGGKERDEGFGEGGGR